MVIPKQLESLLSIHLVRPEQFSRMREMSPFRDIETRLGAERGKPYQY